MPRRPGLAESIRLLRGLAGVGLLTSLVLAVSVAAEDDQAPEKRIVAKRINPHAPVVDGRLDDAAWAKAQFIGGFVQKQPDEGEPAGQQTEIAVLYDDEAVYVGARMHSTDPDNIISTLSRRDNVSNSERIIVSLDTYKDRRTAYTFGVTASGVRVDYYHSSDDEYDRDYDFDPVWQAKAARTPDGWTAEMRIPFTQLRFNNTDVQTWGVNVNRWSPRTNEDSYLILVPKQETGWSSRMVDVVGIQGVNPSRRVEIMPYFASDATRVSDTGGDPFVEQSEVNTRAGADLKMGVGPNLTLDVTVNPDFGQVEADPAQVNLTAYEIYFDERRPFFTEGSELLAGQRVDYFYSRRIGANPSNEPEGDYVDSPNYTSILGAAKLTGRLNSGLSIGVLGAMTQHEVARVAVENPGQSGDFSFHEEEVEPAAGWGVVRLQQEFGRHASTVGVSFTGVERNLDANTTLPGLLRKRAFAGGADWNLRFQGGKYELRGNVGFSRVEGSAEAIRIAQESSARYYQRPDNDYADYDTTRTSLDGWVARMDFEKEGGKHWLWGGGVSVESPGFEINDLGRLGRADEMNYWAGGWYRQTDPGPVFREWWAGTWVGSGYNFGGERRYSFLDMETSWTFKNFIGTFFGLEYYPSSMSDNLTRGGPLMRTAEAYHLNASIWNGGQSKTSWNLWGHYAADEFDSADWGTGASVTLRPGSRWQLSISPTYRQIREARQYIQTEEGSGTAATYDNRYIFSFIERGEVRVTTRLNFAFTPDFTLELYAEPFASSGRYYDIGELAAAGTSDTRLYGSDGTTITRDPDGNYTVTDGTTSFGIDNPDFNYVSFRSNLVLRWEWRPGSTLFLVWQQNSGDDSPAGDLVKPGSLWDAFRLDGDNFLAIKLTYWIPFL